jgi:hypothetical protein
MPMGQHCSALGVLAVWWGMTFLCVGGVSHFFPSLAMHVKIVIFGIAYVGIGILLYRFFSFFRPLPTGEITPGSPAEWTHNVFHLPIILFLYHPVSFSRLIPAPLTRLWARLWGMKIGRKSYPGLSCLGDPQFLQIGDNVTIGQDSLLTAHVMEGDLLAHYPIRVGNRATIGAKALIYAGVTVGEGAIVAGGAVVPKFTEIGPHEIWGGVPARLIKKQPM